MQGFTVSSPVIEKFLRFKEKVVNTVDPVRDTFRELHTSTEASLLLKVGRGVASHTEMPSNPDYQSKGAWNDWAIKVGISQRV